MEKVIHPLAHPAPRPRLLRVAAYARVSSGKDAMLHSLSRQISSARSRALSLPLLPASCSRRLSLM